MLVEGIDLWHHRGRVALQRQGDLPAQAGLQGIGILGRHLQVEGPGVALRQYRQAIFFSPNLAEAKSAIDRLEDQAQARKPSVVPQKPLKTRPQ